MKYLLTQDELDNLISLDTYKEEIKKRDEALKWVFNKLKPEWCENRTYCDSCSIDGLLSFLKENTEKPTREISRMICRKQRRYSK